MARVAAFQFQRSMFEYERALLVAVAFHTGLIAAYGQLCLLGFKTAMGIVAIAASHRALEHLVMKRL